MGGFLSKAFVQFRDNVAKPAIATAIAGPAGVTALKALDRPSGGGGGGGTPPPPAPASAAVQPKPSFFDTVNKPLLYGSGALLLVGVTLLIVKRKG